MTRIAIVTDSTSDLSGAAIPERGFEIVPFGVNIGHDVFRDQVDINSSDFLNRLSMSAPHPTTFSPTAGAFEAVFRRLGKDFDTIVAVLLSSKLGGAVRAAAAAAAAVSEVARVEVVDSMNASLGLGFQVMRALELAEAGAPVDELVARLNAERTLYHLAFFCDSLDYLQHGGRIGLAASVVGGLLQLKPLLQIEEGQVVPMDRARSRAKATAELIDFGSSFTRIDRLGLVYSTGAADAEFLRSSLSRKANPARTMTAQFGPVLTAHVGPGALGVCVFEGPEPI